MLETSGLKHRETYSFLPGTLNVTPQVQFRFHAEAFRPTFDTFRA